MFPSWSWAGWDFSRIYDGCYVALLIQDTIHREAVWYKVMDDCVTTLPVNNSVLAYMDSRITAKETVLDRQWKRADFEVPTNYNMCQLIEPQASPGL